MSCLPPLAAAVDRRRFACPLPPLHSTPQVSKTISQMVMFIKQEAEEKAAEIAVSAEEEFNITKLQVCWRGGVPCRTASAGVAGRWVLCCQGASNTLLLLISATISCVCTAASIALQLLEAEKARVRREFERREAAIEVKKKVGAGALQAVIKASNGHLQQSESVLLIAAAELLLLRRRST